jgi:hypothetical protein
MAITTIAELNTLIDAVNTGRLPKSEIVNTFNGVRDLLSQNNTASVILIWSSTTTYDTPATASTSGNPAYADYGDRLWKSKTDGNLNNVPPTDTDTTENMYWIEVSKAAASPLQEWTPGIYGSGLIIVFHNDVFYKLVEPVRPYDSQNIENEITAGDWTPVFDFDYGFLRIENYQDLADYAGIFNDVYVRGSGIEGQFIYDALSTATPDGATIIPATGKGSGNWVRDYQGYPKLKWWLDAPGSTVTAKYKLGFESAQINSNGIDCRETISVNLDFTPDHNSDPNLTEDTLVRKLRYNITAAAGDGLGNTIFDVAHAVTDDANHQVRVDDEVFLTSTNYNGWYKVVAVTATQLTVDVPFYGTDTGTVHVGGKWKYITINKPGFEVLGTPELIVRHRLQKVRQYSYDYGEAGILFYDITERVKFTDIQLPYVDVNNTLYEGNDWLYNGVRTVKLNHEDTDVTKYGSHFKNVVFNAPRCVDVVSNTIVVDGVTFRKVNHIFENVTFKYGGSEVDNAIYSQGGVTFINPTFSAEHVRRSSHGIYAGLDRPGISVLGGEFRWVGGKADQLNVLSAQDDGTGELRLNTSLTTHGAVDALITACFVEISTADHEYTGWHPIKSVDAAGGYIVLDTPMGVSTAVTGTVYTIGTGGNPISWRGSSGKAAESLVVNGTKFHNCGEMLIGYISTGAAYKKAQFINNYMEHASVRFEKLTDCTIRGNTFNKTNVKLGRLTGCAFNENTIKEGTLTVSDTFSKTSTSGNHLIDSNYIYSGNTTGVDFSGNFFKISSAYNRHTYVATLSPDCDFKRNDFKVETGIAAGHYLMSANFIGNARVQGNTGFLEGAIGTINRPWTASNDASKFIYTDNHFVLAGTGAADIFQLQFAATDTNVIIDRNSIVSLTGWSGGNRGSTIPDNIQWGKDNYFPVIATSSEAVNGPPQGNHYVKSISVITANHALSPTYGVYFNVVPDAVGRSYKANQIRKETLLRIGNITSFDVDFNADDGLSTLYIHRAGDLIELYKKSDGTYQVTKIGNIDGIGDGSATDMVSSGFISDLNAAWESDVNNALKTFKYDNAALNKPASADHANWLMNVYGNVKNYGHQISAVNSENIYFRHVNNGVFGAWLNLWHSGNDSNFAKKDANNTFVGDQVIDPAADINRNYIVKRTRVDGLHQISMGVSTVPYLLSRLDGVLKCSLNFRLDGTLTDVNGKRLLNTDDLAKVYSTEQTITDGLTVTFDVSKGVNAKVTLGGNRTLAFSNVIAGQTLVLKVIQDATGSRTLALPANCKVMNGGGGAVTLTAAASAVDILTFYYDGTNFWVTYGKNFT